MVLSLRLYNGQGPMIWFFTYRMRGGGQNGALAGAVQWEMSDDIFFYIQDDRRVAPNRPSFEDFVPDHPDL